MNGTTLSAMLDRAIADEPLIGPVVQKALLAGIRRRRRRRTSGIAAGAAVVAAASIIVPALARAHSTTSAPVTPTGIPTVYLANWSSYGAGWVTPISTATNTVGPPIKVGGNPYVIVITP